jgi:hypothetical protein
MYEGKTMFGIQITSISTAFSTVILGHMKTKFQSNSNIQVPVLEMEIYKCQYGTAS